MELRCPEKLWIGIEARQRITTTDRLHVEEARLIQTRDSERNRTVSEQSDVMGDLVLLIAMQHVEVVESGKVRAAEGTSSMRAFPSQQL